MIRRLGLGVAVLSALLLCVGAPAYAQDSHAIDEPLGFIDEPLGFQGPAMPSEMEQDPREPGAIASAPSTVEQERVTASDSQGAASSPPRPRRWSRKVWLWILGAILVVAVVCPNCAGG